MAPPLDLKDLRNLSKRDPSGYHAEFLLQYRHFQTQLQIFLLKPAEDYKPFSELVDYLCHVSDIYTKDMPDFPEQIANLLEKNCDILAPPLRKSLVSALILLRSKNQITPHSTLSLFFKLFRCPDANLREMLYKHIVNDITNINKKHKNQSLNHALQNFMYTMMKDPSEIAAKNSLNVMIELYRKRIWNDPKTVNVISTGVFSKSSNIVVATLKFFLTVAADDEEDRIAEAKEKATLTIKKMNLKLSVKKMNRGERKKNEAILEQAQHNKIVERKLDPNWPAIELINDPAGYTEKVFGVTRHSFDRIEVRLMLMNFVSRLIYTHKLLILNFYPFVQKYLMPKNEHVTYALSILAQCVHDLVPPTDLQPIVKHLVDKFVHDKSSNESIVCGLHTIREMCTRNPLIMDDTLLRDLSQYKNYKDKAVVAAARGLIGVYRLKNPELLLKADRGKVGSMNKEKPLAYGEVKVSSGIEGIELLDAVEKIEALEQKAGKKAAELDLEGNVIAYEDESEDDEDGWMEVDGEGSDDDDEEGEEMEDDASEEEVAIVRSMKKKGTKGGVVPTVGVMSIADAMKMQETNMHIVEKQRAKQLREREKRKRGEVEEDEEDEGEDEDEDEDEESEVEEEEKEPEVDIWSRIEMASTPQAPANGVSKTAPAKPEPTKIAPAKLIPVKSAAQNGKAQAQNGKSQVQNGKVQAQNVTSQVQNGKSQAKERNEKIAALPPKKRAKFELVEIESDEEEELEEMDSDDEGEEMWEEVSEGEGESEDEDEGEWVDMEEENEEEVDKKKGKTEEKKGKPEGKKGKVDKKKGKLEIKKGAVDKKKKQQAVAPAKELMEKKASTENATEPHERIDQTRILTEEDYEKLNRLKEMKAEGRITLARLREVANSIEDEGDSDEEDGQGFIDPESLRKGIKDPRKRGEERMAEVMERRNSREKRTKIKLKFTTNAENTKRKNMMMIVKGKKQYDNAKKSWRENQVNKQNGKKKFNKRKHK